jgi:hypothetical protein
MTTRTITVEGDGDFSNGLVVPLTTIFTRPSDCPWPLELPVMPPDTETRTVNFTTCDPPRFSTVWKYGFYSPGVCPSGYTIGCSYTNYMGPAWSITPGETAVWCVPR